VTTVKKGGKLMSFRAVVVAGNGEGKVGVGCSKAKEVRAPPPSLPRSAVTRQLREPTGELGSR
jgi:hypothetical protein